MLQLAQKLFLQTLFRIWGQFQNFYLKTVLPSKVAQLSILQKRMSMLHSNY